MSNAIFFVRLGRVWRDCEGAWKDDFRGFRIRRGRGRTFLRGCYGNDARLVRRDESQGDQVRCPLLRLSVSRRLVEGESGLLLSAVLVLLAPFP